MAVSSSMAAGVPPSPVGGLVGIAAHSTAGRKAPPGASSSTPGVKPGAVGSKARKAGGPPRGGPAAPSRTATSRPAPAHIVFDTAPLSPQGRKTRAIHEALRCIHLSPSHRSGGDRAAMDGSGPAVPHARKAADPHAATPIMLVTPSMGKSSTTTRIGPGNRLQSAKGPGPNKASKLMGAVEKKKRNKSASAASRRKRDEPGLREDEMVREASSLG